MLYIFEKIEHHIVQFNTSHIQINKKWKYPTKDIKYLTLFDLTKSEQGWFEVFERKTVHCNWPGRLGFHGFSFCNQC